MITIAITKSGLLACATPPDTVPTAGQSHAAGVMSRTLRIGLLLACSLGASYSVESLAQSAVSGDSVSVLEQAVKPGTLATRSSAQQPIKRANLNGEAASPQTRELADWIIDSNDNHQLPFLIVDKTGAKTFAFDATGQLQGAAAVLLGTARGDDSTPGIGQRKLSTIRPEEKTTPAGRFPLTPGRNLQGKDIYWVDYEAAISLHRVITSNGKERRAERLASSSIEDNRISSGCINVPANFYDTVLISLFKKANGIAYILPETRSLHSTFGSYDVDDESARQAARQPPTPSRAPAALSTVIKLR